MEGKFGVGILCLALAGCTGIPTENEKIAREQLASVTAEYLPGGQGPELPALDAHASLNTLLRYALLNQPRVRAAYYDFVTSVERITLERSLPDPRFTLELDIQDVVMVVMPGLMTEVPWLQRLRVRADEASAESQAKYQAFRQAVLEAAFALKGAYFRLRFLEERLHIMRETLALAGELETVARAQTEAAKATLQDVLRAQIEQDKLRTEIANLEDSRAPLMAQFKAALGLRQNDADPPVPAEFEATPSKPDFAGLQAAAFSQNPRLRQMQAELQMAEAGIRLAQLSRLPDFSAGLEADVKASPAMWRPSLGMTLPIWRDKIAAEIAAAQARQGAAQARLSAEEIQLAVEFAMKSYEFREAGRNLALYTDNLLPKARQALEVARVSYTSARTEFINLLDAERNLLEFQLAEIEARTRHEITMAELSMVIAGIVPGASPKR